MNSPLDPLEDSHFQRLCELTVGYCDGLLSSDESAELQQMLRSSEDSRHLFVRLHRERIALREVLTSQEEDIDVRAMISELRVAELAAEVVVVPDQDELTEAYRIRDGKEVRESTDNNQSPRSTLVMIPRKVIWGAIAAAILVAAWLVGGLLGPENNPKSGGLAIDSRQPEDAHGVTPSRAVRVGVVVATLDAEWDEAQPAEPGAAVFDRPINLTAGIVQIEMTNGVFVTLEGPCVFKPDSADRVHLTRGKLVGRVPVNAIGFTVHTPAMDIVDLSTEFAIQVEPVEGDAVATSSEVSVLDGRVQVRPSGGDEGGFRAEVLAAGESRRAEPGSRSLLAAQTDPRSYYRRVPGRYERTIRESDPLAYWRFEQVDRYGRLEALGRMGAYLFGATGRDMSSDAAPVGEQGDHALWCTDETSAIEAGMPLVLGSDGSGLTFESWVWVPASVDRRMRVVSNAEHNALGEVRRGIAFGVSGKPEDTAGEPVLQVTGYGRFEALSAASVPTERWVHVAATYSSEGDLQLYIDGQPQEVQVKGQARAEGGGWSITESRAPLRVAGAMVSADNVAKEHWVGGIDELAIYDRVLSADQIAEHAGTREPSAIRNPQ